MTAECERCRKTFDALEESETLCLTCQLADLEDAEFKPSGCTCDDPLTPLLVFGGDPMCWSCHVTALGAPDEPEPEPDQRVRVIARLREVFDAHRATAAPAETVELLNDVRAFVRRYVVLPSDEIGDLLALWVLHTHAFPAWFATPYLRIVSAAPECGKSLLIEILAVLSRNGWHTVNPSSAVLYRKVDAHSPTLLLDEVDNFPIDDRRDALAVLNAGYKRGARVDRCKENGDLQSFDCFCPKAFAGLDTRAMPPALLSRSVTIRMERKTSGDRAERWIGQLTLSDAAKLRERCAAWAAQHVGALSTATPDLPDGLGDRACEVWWALLAIAELAQGDWPARAREAARVLSAGGDGADEESQAEQLLSDIRDVFTSAQVNVIRSSDLLAGLNALDERPWGTRRRGEGLDVRGLAQLLRPFRIKTKTIRVSGYADTQRGYHVDQFADAFDRYLARVPENPTHATRATHPNAHGAGDVLGALPVLPPEGDASEDEERLAERLLDDYPDGELR
jgi:hypothetical protein